MDEAREQYLRRAITVLAENPAADLSASPDQAGTGDRSTAALDVLLLLIHGMDAG